MDLGTSFLGGLGDVHSKLLQSKEAGIMEEGNQGKKEQWNKWNRMKFYVLVSIKGFTVRKSIS